MAATLTDLVTGLALPRARRRRRPPALLSGGAIVVALLAVALFAQFIAPYPFDQMHVRDRLAPPSLHYLAGTDEYGRDIFSRLLFGSQLSIALVDRT